MSEFSRNSGLCPETWEPTASAGCSTCEGAAWGQGVPQGVRATRGEEGKESPPGDGRAVPSVSGTGPPAWLKGHRWLVGGREGPSVWARETTLSF